MCIPMYVCVCVYRGEGGNRQTDSIGVWGPAVQVSEAGGVHACVRAWMCVS